MFDSDRRFLLWTVLHVHYDWERANSHGLCGDPGLHLCSDEYVQLSSSAAREMLVITTSNI